MSLNYAILLEKIIYRHLNLQIQKTNMGIILKLAMQILAAT